MKGRRTGMCCELNSDYSSDIQQVITQLYVVVPVHPSDEEVPGVGVAGKNIFAAPLPPSLPPSMFPRVGFICSVLHAAADKCCAPEARPHHLPLVQPTFIPSLTM